MSGECAGAVSGLVRSVDVRRSAKGITPTHAARERLQDPHRSQEEEAASSPGHARGGGGFVKKNKKKQEEAQHVLLEHLPYPLLIMSGSKAGHWEVQGDQATPGAADRPTDRPTVSRGESVSAVYPSVCIVSSSLCSCWVSCWQRAASSPPPSTSSVTPLLVSSLAESQRPRSLLHG